MNKYDDDSVAKGSKPAGATIDENASGQIEDSVDTPNGRTHRGVRDLEENEKPGSSEEWERRYKALLKKQKETERKLVATEKRNADLEEKVDVLRDCIKFFENERNNGGDR